MMNSGSGSRHQADTDGHMQAAFEMLMQKSICTESSFMVGLPLLRRGPDREEEGTRKELKCELALSVPTLPTNGLIRY